MIAAFGLKQLIAPELSQVGMNFLGLNKKLTDIEAPNLTIAGEGFLKQNSNNENDSELFPSKLIFSAFVRNRIFPPSF